MRNVKKGIFIVMLLSATILSAQYGPNGAAPAYDLLADGDALLGVVGASTGYVLFITAGALTSVDLDVALVLVQISSVPMIFGEFMLNSSMDKVWEKWSAKGVAFDGQKYLDQGIVDSWLVSGFGVVGLIVPFIMPDWTGAIISVVSTGAAAITLVVDMYSVRLAFRDGLNKAVWDQGLISAWYYPQTELL